MATKRPARRKTTKKLKRGQAIRVPGAGTVTIGRDGEVVWRGTPMKPNPTRRRKPAKKATAKRRKPAARKRLTRRTATRRARR